MYNRNNINRNTGQYSQQSGYYGEAGYGAPPGTRQTPPPPPPPPPLGQQQQQRQAPPPPQPSSFTTYSAPPSTYGRPYQVPGPERFQRPPPQPVVSKSSSPVISAPPSSIVSSYKSMDSNKSSQLNQVPMTYEQAIAQQQSIYDYSAPPSIKDESTTSSGVGSSGQTPSPAPNTKDQQHEKNITVKRKGGGQKWEDPSLLEWDPSHFRLFVGNLGGDMNDEILFKAFAKYPSISKARVIRDKRTLKTRGYGFVAFKDSQDYFKAFKEMNGKYVGSHPVLLRKAVTDVRPTTQGSSKSKFKGSILKGPSSSTSRIK